MHAVMIIAGDGTVGNMFADVGAKCVLQQLNFLFQNVSIILAICSVSYTFP